MVLAFVVDNPEWEWVELVEYLEYFVMVLAFVVDNPEWEWVELVEYLEYFVMVLAFVVDNPEREWVELVESYPRQPPHVRQAAHLREKLRRLGTSSTDIKRDRPSL
jgi:predicted mannosyl-3-phosphoglycerate phosphatase (HAD superfamily)